MRQARHTLQILIFIGSTVKGGVECPTGSFMESISQDCVPCPSGTYQSYPNVAGGCWECNRGMYSTGIGMDSPRACKNCASGTYAINSSVCEPCPAHTTSPQGAFRLQECRARAGYYSKEGGTGVGCPSNHFCPAGTTRPAKCPSGTTSGAMQSECQPIMWVAVRGHWLLGGIWLTLVLLCTGWWFLHKHALRNLTAGGTSGPMGEIKLKIAL
jgi:hypothetical protein